MRNQLALALAIVCLGSAGMYNTWTSAEGPRPVALQSVRVADEGKAQARSDSAQGEEAKAKPARKFGPFGLWFGMSKEEAETLCTLTKVPGSPGLYVIKGIPAPVAPFATYAGTFDDKLGLLHVLATSEIITTNIYGENLKIEYRKIETALKSKYGTGKHFDMLRAGSMWDDPEDWMMGLLKGERLLGAMWTRENSVLLPDGLGQVLLGTKAENQGAAQLFLAYESTTYEAWNQRQQQANADGL